jgi:hypothetical protein
MKKTKTARVREAAIMFRVNVVDLAVRTLRIGDGEYALKNYVKLLSFTKERPYTFRQMLDFEARGQNGHLGVLCGGKDTSPLDDALFVSLFSADIEEKAAWKAIDHDVVMLTLRGGLELFAKREELTLAQISPDERKEISEVLKDPLGFLEIQKAEEGSVLNSNFSVLADGGNVAEWLVNRIRDVGIENLYRVDRPQSPLDKLILSVWLDDDKLIEKYGEPWLLSNGLSQLALVTDLLHPLWIGWRKKSEKCVKALLRLVGYYGKKVFLDHEYRPKFGDKEMGYFLVDWNPDSDMLLVATKSAGLLRIPVGKALYELDFYPFTEDDGSGCFVIQDRFVEYGALAPIGKLFCNV